MSDNDYKEAQIKFNKKLKKTLPRPVYAKKVVPAWGVQVKKGDHNRKLETLEGVIQISPDSEVIFMGPGILDYTKNHTGVSYLARYSQRFDKNMRSMLVDPFGTGKYRTDFYTFKNVQKKYSMKKRPLVIEGLEGMNSWLNGRTMHEYIPKGRDATSLKKVYILNKKFQVYTDWASSDANWRSAKYQIASSSRDGGVLATWDDDKNNDLSGDVWIINKALFLATHALLKNSSIVHT